MWTAGMLDTSKIGGRCIGGSTQNRHLKTEMWTAGRIKVTYSGMEKHGCGRTEQSLRRTWRRVCDL